MALSGTTALDPTTLPGNEYVAVCRSADGLSRDQWTLSGSGFLQCEYDAQSIQVSGLSLGGPFGFTVSVGGAMDVALAIAGVAVVVFAFRAIARAL